jgi:hypothetical protein
VPLPEAYAGRVSGIRLAGCRAGILVRSRFAGKSEDAATCANRTGALCISGVAFDVLSEFFLMWGLDVRLMCRRPVLDVACCAFDVPPLQNEGVYVRGHFMAGTYIKRTPLPTACYGARAIHCELREGHAEWSRTHYLDGPGVPCGNWHAVPPSENDVGPVVGLSYQRSPSTACALSSSSPASLPLPPGGAPLP